MMGTLSADLTLRILFLAMEMALPYTRLGENELYLFYVCIVLLRLKNLFWEGDPVVPGVLSSLMILVAVRSI
jgi:hypothetical protein